MRRVLVPVLVLAWCVSPAMATSYPPVTLHELIARADVIFVGEVIDVRPFPLGTRDGTIVKTRVVFRVTDSLWGTASTLEAFDFLGGEWGDIGLAIAEMPSFATGDRRIVFARRDRSINPIVGFTQGLLEIERDNAGVDRVRTLDGWPLSRPESIGQAPSTAFISPLLPMRLADFRGRINRAIVDTQKR